ncbi:MAG TPA: TetR/AcrR family transcriptional regulator [Bdellovibrio sp.]|uniref:TetR/AcrR family transcriptional regulator n=1 Tax=Bdellovibrio sp. TaxID=28201 RepID=UPI002F21CCBC
MKTSKRDEIIQTAYAHFYKEGFHAAGVDRVLEGTGISKRTLYKYFGSKEELIEATLDHYRHVSSDSIYQVIEKKTSPEDKALAIFDWLHQVLQSGHTMGCYAMKARLEYNDRNSAIEKKCDDYFALTEELLYPFLKEAGCSEAKKLSRQLAILFRGTILTAQASKDPAVVLSAKAAAKVLLKNAMT